MAFETEPLGKKHNRAAFSSGVPELDQYLKERASQDAKKRVAAPFVHIDPETARIVGYYTLSAFSAELVDLPDETVKKLPRYPVLPATLIGRLAVDEEFRGKGFGAFLLIDALRRCLDGSRNIASFAVVVDAKDENAEAFYEHFGFLRFKSVPRRLFMPMGTVEKLFAENTP
ncbi:MAG: GNAT family N-acetyltransferase [Parvularculaceae bacterium]